VWFLASAYWITTWKYPSNWLYNFNCRFYILFHFIQKINNLKTLYIILKELVGSKACECVIVLVFVSTTWVIKSTLRTSRKLNESTKKPIYLHKFYNKFIHSYLLLSQKRKYVYTKATSFKKKSLYIPINS